MEINKKHITIVELFSGIGGFSKGLSDAGYTFKKHYYSEIDKHAIANYKYNFKDAEYIGSVTDVRGRELERPNIITFGSPCQDFSLAGKRAGMEGQRSSLITEAIRLITECRPDVFIWENVKGAFSSNDGADFWGIIQAFTNIGGYRLEWQLLNTSWFLPQNRERIYLIGHLADRSKPGVFPIRETGKLYSGAREVKKEIHPNNRLAITQQARQYASWCGDFIKVKALTEARTDEAKEIRKESRKQGKDFSPRRGKKITVRNDDNSNTITATQGIEQTIMIHNTNMSGEVFKNGYAGTLRSDASANYQLVNGIRRLTEIECERLQGFPDDFSKFGNYDGVVKEIPKTQRYKMCGNAVTTNVVRAIGERLNLLYL